MENKEKETKRVYYVEDKNIGDVLAPYIVEHFTRYTCERATSTEEGKVIVMGSILELVSNGDIVIGIGSNKPDFILRDKKNVTFMSVRGPLTRKNIEVPVPEIYGDMGLLLPRMYNPTSIEKKKKIGIVPHYIDKRLFKEEEYIDIEQPWHDFVDRILECEMIVSSSLHGIVIAEAYGIPCQWGVYSSNIEGGEFKYQDYFLGTGRPEQEPFTDIPPIKNLFEIQTRLETILKLL